MALNGEGPGSQREAHLARGAQHRDCGVVRLCASLTFKPKPRTPGALWWCWIWRGREWCTGSERKGLRKRVFDGRCRRGSGDDGVSNRWKTPSLVPISNPYAVGCNETRWRVQKAGFTMTSGLSRAESLYPRLVTSSPTDDAYGWLRARLQGYKTEARVNPALESHPSKGWAPTSAHPRSGVITEGKFGLARAGVQRDVESSISDYTRRRLVRPARRIVRRHNPDDTRTQREKGSA